MLRKKQDGMSQIFPMKTKIPGLPGIQRLSGLIFDGLVIPAVLLAAALQSCGDTDNRIAEGWEKVPGVMKQIVAPEFPPVDFKITDYGAVGDGGTDCTVAFRSAIDSCSGAGGGRVVVPEGVYLTGAIHLKSNVNLHLTKNATILFSEETDKYLPVVYTRFEGVECMNYSPFIYAFEQENIAITGSGLLDGQAGPDSWWPWSGKRDDGWKAGEPEQKNDRNELFRMAEEGIPVAERVFGKNHYLRPNFIQPYKCRNVLIDSVTIKRSPMWEIHPVLCENVTVQNIHIISLGPNNDGCDPESSKNVLIRNSFFDTGDDCIAIKSGRNADGRRVNEASENIIVQGCKMKDGHGGVVIGSEITGSCRNVFVEDCFMDSPNLERVLRIKSNSMRGGVVEDIYMRNITVGEVRDAILRVNFQYGEGDTGPYTPVVKDIFLSNITSKKSKYAISLSGYKRSPVTNIILDSCRFNGVQKGNILKNYKNLSMSDVYINNQLQKD